jgi:hypothetical protein
MKIVAALLLWFAFLLPVILADDLSTFQCTANDVQIVGDGTITNEPCNCVGTFDANVTFTVRNNAASDRGCITLHLPRTVLPDGTVIEQTDIILNGGEAVPGKDTRVFSGLIEDYPCGAGRVCFGNATADGRRRCGPGECSTVSWTVPGQDTCPPAKQISSKCRHQQICITGRGITIIDCNANTAPDQDTCEVPCGGSAKVEVCTTGGPAPYEFSLSGTGGVTITPTSPVTSSALCQNFTVSGVTGTVTLTATVEDNEGCARNDTATLTTADITPPIINSTVFDTCIAEGTSAEINVFPDIDDATYFFTVDGEDLPGASDNTLLYTQNPDDMCHIITASYSVAGCRSGNVTLGISQCIFSEKCTVI